VRGLDAVRGLEALRQAARRVATRRIVPFPPSPLPDKL
jgi:hypothetical protein